MQSMQSAQAEQLARAFANRAAARLLDGQYELAYADATAAVQVCHLSETTHEKAAHRAAEALKRLGLNRHVLLDTQLARKLKAADRGTDDSVSDVSRAFLDANTLYAQAARRGSGSRAALHKAIDAYSAIVVGLRGVHSLAVGVFIASSAEGALAKSFTVPDGRSLVEEAAQMAVAAATVVPSARTLRIVSEAQAALASADAKRSRMQTKQPGSSSGKVGDTAADAAGLMMHEMQLYKVPPNNQMAEFGSMMKLVEPMPNRPHVVGVDEDWVSTVLDAGYKQCRMLPYVLISALVSAKPPVEWLRKRLGPSVDGRKMDWWKDAEIGDCYEQDDAAPHVSGSRCALPSVPDPPLHAVAGTVVLVGHVGLDGMADYHNPEGLHTEFVGVEACAFNSAASRVLWRACGARLTDQELVMLMYSTTWSKNAFDVFIRCAAEELCCKDLTEAQRSHLQRWASGVARPLDSARRLVRARLFRSTHGTSATSCWMVCGEEERAEVARYELTGDMPELRPEDDARVASLLMADREDEIGDMPSVYSTVCMRRIAACSGNTLMQKTTAALCKRAGTLKAMHASGGITATFLNADVRSVAKKLAARKPKTVVWSNVVDYAPLEQLHAVASSIGTRGCVHHAHSIAWTQNVFGASALDLTLIADAEERKKTVVSVIKAGHNVNVQLAKRAGLANRFKDPLPINPINIMQRKMQGPRVQRAWLERFRSAADAAGGATVLSSTFVSSLPMCSFGHCTLHFAFTYDPEIAVQREDLAQHQK